MQRKHEIIATAIVIFLGFLFSSNLYADPSSRVGRLSYIQGVVSILPADTRSKIWVPARINLSLIPGDRLWADVNARAEIQLGNAALRMQDLTSLRILNLNNRIAQFDVAEGSVVMQVRRIDKNQVYEIDTPQLAFKMTQPGNYRVDVDDAGTSTTVTIRSGKATVYTKNTYYKITKPGSYRYVDNRFSQVTVYKLDNFDKWSLERERRTSRSISQKYVSVSLIGYEDLDSYGRWVSVQEYGNVWIPNRTGSGWAPYRNGNWSWVEPWGWTWIDDEPWGFATTHYGRWALYNNTWVWVPGRKVNQATYAPALVAFVGGSGFQISISVGNSSTGIAWFPLGPRDVYVPPYKVSEQYFSNINVNNTTINSTQINNVYNNTTVQNNYTYQQVPTAITAVPTKAFVESAPVAAAAVAVTPAEIKQAPASTTVDVKPENNIAPPSTTAVKPSDATLNKDPVVATPPATPTSIDTTLAPSANESTTAATIPAASDTGKEGTAVQPQQANGDAPVKPEAATTADQVTQDKTNADSKAVTDQTAADKAKQEQAPADAKVDADKGAADKVQQENAATAVQAGADKAEVAKVQQEQAAADAKAAADKVAADKVQQVNAAAEAQAGADKAEAAKAQQDQAAADAKAAADKVAADKVHQANAAAEAQQEQADAKAAADKVAADKAQQKKAAADARAEADKVAADKAQQEQATAAEAQAGADRAEAAKAQQEKAAADASAAADSAAADKAQQAKAAAEAQAGADRAEAAKAQQEKAAADAKAEADRAAADKAQQAQAAAQAQEAADRAEAARAQQEKAAAVAKAEADRITADNARQEKAAADERAQADKAAADSKAAAGQPTR
jgi:hypothetical protein